LHNNIISVIQTEDAIRKAALDSQMAMQQMRLDAALRLSERGNDELLQIEMNRMEKLQEERERMARRQVATNAAVQASSAALAAVQAITTITTYGATGGVPGVIAAGIALAATIPAMLALVQSLTAQASRGFASGGYTGDGPKMSIAGTVHKGEFVFNKEITAKYRPVFEEIHRTGQMPQYVTNNTIAQPVDLTPLVEAFRQGQIVQEINFDEHGIGVMTRRSARADKRRWRGR